ncbi:DMP19 family protein [Blastopirellula retiformator]|uniref:DNA mimic protein DMP19 C-terminal domain-containing protein n=1 Tax=Blastopirellula retiformator TaxID=2527970 RepID=A0A5C5V3Q1_9BACT|nr:DUF4375 domain-containing protein [Blastopirellula retiformator]TWT33011.1 hypothetical protein Enr8_28290 [Blastopirellula retiformator]
MNDEALLEQVSDTAFKMLKKVDNDPTQIEEPYRTVAIIYAAQGVIDNGGLIYFFESDWPGQPPYSLFADAYQRIGRVEAAAALREAAESFGITEPEKHREQRQAYMDRFLGEDEDDEEFEEVSEGIPWNDCICGDEQVWTDLAAWVRKNPAP